MPPVSRFGGSGRTKKKQGVIDKLKAFFDKYYGVGGSFSFTESKHNAIVYERHSPDSVSRVAVPEISYGSYENK